MPHSSGGESSQIGAGNKFGISGQRFGPQIPNWSGAFTDLDDLDVAHGGNLLPLESPIPYGGSWIHYSSASAARRALQQFLASVSSPGENLNNTLLGVVAEPPFTPTVWVPPDRHSAVSRGNRAAVGSQSGMVWESTTILQGWPNQAQSHIPAIPQFGRDIDLIERNRAAQRADVWQNPQGTVLAPVVETPFTPVDWQNPVGLAVARRNAQAQVAIHSQPDVTENTPLILLTTPAPPVQSTLPEYLAAPYVVKAKRYVSLRAPPEVIGSFPTIILTTPGFNLTPGVVVAPDFLAVNHRRAATHAALRAQAGGNPQTWLTTPAPPEGQRTYPDRLPHPRYRQHQAEGNAQAWLATPPPPEGRSVQPERLTTVRRHQPELTPNVLNSVLEVVAPALPDGVQVFPARLPRPTYRQHLTVWEPTTLLQGWQDQSQSHLPSIPRFGRDIDLLRKNRAAQQLFWQNQQGRMPPTVVSSPTVLRLNINSNPSDSPELDSNPSDTAGVKF